MKTYTKENHFIMAVDLRQPNAEEELLRLAYAFKLHEPLMRYAKPVEDAYYNLQGQRKGGAPGAKSAT